MGNLEGTQVGLGLQLEREMPLDTDFENLQDLQKRIALSTNIYFISWVKINCKKLLSVEISQCKEWFLVYT